MGISASSPSMHCPRDAPIDWQYPPSGPAPPSPVVVNTVPEYFGGRPTPPSSPLKARTTVTVDDYAPCPPTPQCVPSDMGHDELESLPSLDSDDSAISQSTSSETEMDGYPEVDDATSFVVPLADDTPGHGQTQYDGPATYLEYHPSDCLLYSHEVYAYPSPVLAMMRRANLDMCGLETQPVNIYDCGEPLKLFSLSGGHAPRTGLEDHDRQSLEYYDKSPLGEPECFLPYHYPISSIAALQQSLYTEWSLVYPTPIPPVIIRSRDLVGPRFLHRRLQGYAFVVPTEDSIWGTVCRRGIDWDYKPIDPSLEVEVGFVRKGAASYYPQHIVASEFAVNVFLEVADSATGPDPLCEYLGAYVLQTIGPAVIGRTGWMGVDPEVQQDVFNRVPNCFQVYRHPSLDWPQLPYVRFCYYKWDGNMVGLADESLITRSSTSQEDEVKSEDWPDYTSSNFDTD